jgi:hypothetical protein
MAIAASLRRQVIESGQEIVASIAVSLKQARKQPFTSITWYLWLLAGRRCWTILPWPASLARNGPDRIVGYTGTASVSFRTTPDNLGTVLGGSLESEANTISQTQFTPTES